jgi:hypothetical protein
MWTLTKMLGYRDNGKSDTEGPRRTGGIGLPLVGIQPGFESSHQQRWTQKVGQFPDADTVSFHVPPTRHT